MNLLKDWITWVILGEIVVAAVGLGAFVVAVTRRS